MSPSRGEGAPRGPRAAAAQDFAHSRRRPASAMLCIPGGKWPYRARKEAWRPGRRGRIDLKYAASQGREPMRMESSLRILLADDHDIVRQGLKALLERESGWSVCAEAATGRDAVTLALEHRPDIAILDMSMPGLTGIEA